MTHDDFTPDARFRVWGQCHEGREAIVREIGGMQPDVPGKHVVLQPVIDLDASDRARAWTDLSALITGANGQVVVATIGRYHDRLVKGSDALWRFAERAIVMGGEAVPDGVDDTPAR